MSTTNGLGLAVTAVELLVHFNSNCVTSCESTLSLCGSRADVAFKIVLVREMLAVEKKKEDIH